LALTILPKVKQLDRYIKIEKQKQQQLQQTNNNNNTTTNNNNNNNNNNNTSNINSQIINLCLLTKVLSELPLELRHRILFLKLAITTNMEFGNYFTAARLIGELLSLPLEDEISELLPDKEDFEEKLKICNSSSSSGKEKGGLKDQNFMKYVCPVCGESEGQKMVGCRCEKCDTKVKICYTSFQLITEKQYFECPVCDAVYAEDVGKCRFCGVAAQVLPHYNRPT
jgi:ribosomal protein L40E